METTLRIRRAKMLKLDNGVQCDFIPIDTNVSDGAAFHFTKDECRAFLKSHCGGSKEVTLRWGNDCDIATIMEMATKLSALKSGDPTAEVSSLWHTNDGRWLEIKSRVVPGDGVYTEIDGGLTVSGVEFGGLAS
jgi:hypothetical protein